MKIPGQTPSVRRILLVDASKDVSLMTVHSKTSCCRIGSRDSNRNAQCPDRYVGIGEMLSKLLQRICIRDMISSTYSDGCSYRVPIRLTDGLRGADVVIAARREHGSHQSDRANGAGSAVATSDTKCRRRLNANP